MEILIRFNALIVSLQPGTYVLLIDAQAHFWNERQMVEQKKTASRGSVDKVKVAMEDKKLHKNIRALATSLFLYNCELCHNSESDARSYRLFNGRT